MITFGENLYLWRTFRGLSQAELAQRCGIPRPNLSAIENGKIEPSLSTLRSLAAGLEVSAGELADGIGPMHFENISLSRESLEAITRITLGEIKGYVDYKQEAIGKILSKIICNRINARNKIYKKTLKDRHRHFTNWLMLKAILPSEVLNNILTRLDKHMEIGRF